VSGEILITSDTVVWHEGRSLAKPANKGEAFEMLKTLNDNSHNVITSVCFTTTKGQKVINSTTEVTFDKLSDEVIILISINLSIKPGDMEYKSGLV
jgi:septum formation protein